MQFYTGLGWLSPNPCGVGVVLLPCWTGRGWGPPTFESWWVSLTFCQPLGYRSNSPCKQWSVGIEVVRRKFLSCWSPATLERAKKPSLLANTTLPKSLALILARWERALACDSLRLSNIWACGDWDSCLLWPTSSRNCWRSFVEARSKCSM